MSEAFEVHSKIGFFVGCFFFLSLSLSFFFFFFCQLQTNSVLRRLEWLLS